MYLDQKNWRPKSAKLLPLKENQCITSLIHNGLGAQKCLKQSLITKGHSGDHFLHNTFHSSDGKRLLQRKD